MAGIGSSISDTDIQKVRDRLAALERDSSDGLARSLKAVAYLTGLLERLGIQPIVVGGKAVELYTTGSYATVDVDLVLSGYERAREVFERVGFEPKPLGTRHWYHPGLQLPIEIPDTRLDGSLDRVLRVDVGDGYHLYVIGIEDLILDRLRAAVHWKSTSDEEWALLLLKTRWNDIDFAYLEQEAAKPEQGVADLLAALKRQAEQL
ncbi:MAG: nucleotidyltransferase [Alicyclobacillus macrosporangiidus]|uniref:hypothetical protein n=1 Tax=Alicyclobacillus macrosporangiidus TaxID=392015 RepID=UPI0026F073F3|nr:hypothetical protein [Alicyclobacillus macrosporangiidus]MCL6599899.1 nucleotidyltransferase [Alicyclobacillus macrosporangiidus]